MKNHVQTNVRFSDEIARTQRLVSAETGFTQQKLITEALLFFLGKADKKIEKTRQECLVAVERLKGILPFESAPTSLAE